MFRRFYIPKILCSEYRTFGIYNFRVVSSGFHVAYDFTILVSITTVSCTDQDTYLAVPSASSRRIKDMGCVCAGDVTSPSRWASQASREGQGVGDGWGVAVGSDSARGSTAQECMNMIQSNQTSCSLHDAFRLVQFKRTLTPYFRNVLLLHSTLRLRHHH